MHFYGNLSTNGSAAVRILRCTLVHFETECKDSHHYFWHKSILVLIVVDTSLQITPACDLICTSCGLCHQDFSIKWDEQSLPFESSVKVTKPCMNP